MARHQNMTLTRDVSATQFPAPRGSATGGSIKRLVLLAFQKLNTNKDFGSPNWLLSCPRFIPKPSELAAALARNVEAEKDRHMHRSGSKQSYIQP